VIDESTTVYRHDEEKMLAFVERKFDTLYEMLKAPAAKQHINASILANGAPMSIAFVNFV